MNAVLSEQVCAKIRDLGYAPSKRVRIYGEDFQIVSDPFLEDGVIGVRATTTKDPEVRTLHLPLLLLQGMQQLLPKGAAPIS